MADFVMKAFRPNQAHRLQSSDSALNPFLSKEESCFSEGTRAVWGPRKAARPGGIATRGPTGSCRHPQLLPAGGGRGVSWWEEGSASIHSSLRTAEHACEELSIQVF